MGIVPGIGAAVGHLAGELAPLQVSSFDSSTSTGTTVDLPAGCQVGDFAVMYWHAWNGVSSTPGDVAAPSGWDTHQSQVQNHNGFTVEGSRGKLMSKVLDAGDISAGTFTGFNGTQDHKIIQVFRGNRPFASAAANTGGGQLTGGNPTAQACNASGGDVPIVVVGVVGLENNTAAFSTASPAFDGTTATADADMIAGYKIYNTAPQDHSIDMGDTTGANWLASAWFELTE